MLHGLSLMTLQCIRRCGVLLLHHVFPQLDEFLLRLCSTLDGVQSFGLLLLLLKYPLSIKHSLLEGVHRLLRLLFMVFILKLHPPSWVGQLLLMLLLLVVVKLKVIEPVVNILGLLYLQQIVYSSILSLERIWLLLLLLHVVRVALHVG